VIVLNLEPEGTEVRGVVVYIHGHGSWLFVYLLVSDNGRALRSIKPPMEIEKIQAHLSSSLAPFLFTSRVYVFT
jgi:hypothetical protein